MGGNLPTTRILMGINECFWLGCYLRRILRLSSRQTKQIHFVARYGSKLPSYFRRGGAKRRGGKKEAQLPYRYSRSAPCFSYRCASRLSVRKLRDSVTTPAPLLRRHPS